MLADEIAFWTTDAGAANPDREIIAAVRPGLATLPNSMLLDRLDRPTRGAVCCSRPFARYHGRDGAPVLVWRGTTPR